jgi:hypothetical protein
VPRMLNKEDALTLIDARNHTTADTGTDEIDDVLHMCISHDLIDVAIMTDDDPTPGELMFRPTPLGLITAHAILGKNMP